MYRWITLLLILMNFVCLGTLYAETDYERDLQGPTGEQQSPLAETKPLSADFIAQLRTFLENNLVQPFNHGLGSEVFEFTPSFTATNTLIQIENEDEVDQTHSYIGWFKLEGTKYQFITWDSKDSDCRDKDDIAIYDSEGNLIASYLGLETRGRGALGALQMIAQANLPRVLSRPH